MQNSQNIANFLLEGKDPRRVAVILLDRCYTYGELQSGAAAVASYLIDQGGHRGDRVILIADNPFFWISAYLGTLLAGMVSVPLNPAITPDDLEHIVQLTEPRFFSHVLLPGTRHTSRKYRLSPTTGQA